MLVWLLVLHLGVIRSIGNVLNDGDSERGDAQGFDLAILKRLTTTKSNLKVRVIDIEPLVRKCEQKCCTTYYMCACVLCLDRRQFEQNELSAGLLCFLNVECREMNLDCADDSSSLDHYSRSFCRSLQQ